MSSPSVSTAKATRAKPERAAVPGVSAALESGSALPFALAMFVLSHGWIALVREVPTSPWILLSYTLQQACLWLCMLFVDGWLTRRGARFMWAALCTLHTTFVLVDAFLMAMTSLPSREVLPMLLASEHVVEGLREIGLRPSRLCLLAVVFACAAAMGGWLRLRMGERFAWQLRVARRSQLLAIASLALVFAAEQTAARGEDDYLYRGLRMPAYLQLYSTSSRSVVTPIPPPVSHAVRRRWLAQVGEARNPRHVLYVLLESFRADALEPTVTPGMWRLAQRGVQFDRALAEATFTPLSWSVLLFDEAAHDNLFGRHSGRPEPLGAWLFAVMSQAGYQSHAFISTNFTYAKTRDRLLARAGPALDYFQAAADEGDDPADKNRNDREVVNHTLEFIRDHDWSGAPQFLFLQLDSTHYTYPFPEQDALFTPYSENLLLPRPITTEAEARLLHNRYLNAAHYVDEQLQRVIAALQRAGVYEDMAIVLTSDHGEGLAPGMQGHGVIMEATKRVPLIMVLPGRAPEHNATLVSHRDILPSLASYLGIDLPAGATRGRDYQVAGSRAVFTISPSGRLGQLTTADRAVDVGLVWKPRSVTVTPPAASGSAADARAWAGPIREFLSAGP